MLVLPQIGGLALVLRMLGLPADIAESGELEANSVALDDWDDLDDEDRDIIAEALDRMSPPRSLN